LHYYIFVYGSPQEIQQEINKIQFSMNDMGNIGQIRELRLFEIVFNKEYEQEILDKLSNPNPKVDAVLDVIRHFFYGLKIDGQLLDFRKDKRQLKGTSPFVNILAVKEDNKRQDGREFL